MAKEQNKTEEMHVTIISAGVCLGQLSKYSVTLRGMSREK